MNSDLIELLQCLKKYKVKYMIIGGQAVIAYAEPRYTKDLDIWVEPTKDNAKKLVKSLRNFGAPMTSVSEEDFSKEGTIFIFGVDPNRVDILTKIKGATFKTAYKSKTQFNIGKFKADFISLHDLIKVKKATARPQDLIDVEKLQISLRASEKKSLKK